MAKRREIRRARGRGDGGIEEEQQYQFNSISELLLLLFGQCVRFVYGRQCYMWCPYMPHILFSMNVHAYVWSMLRPWSWFICRVDFFLSFIIVSFIIGCSHHHNRYCDYSVVSCYCAHLENSIVFFVIFFCFFRTAHICVCCVRGTWLTG